MAASCAKSQRTQFIIPKKNSDLLVPIQRTSYEYDHEILPAVVRSFVNPLSEGHFVFGEAHVVHNQALLSEYLQKRKEMRQAGYKDREVSDSFAFYHCSDNEVNQICSDGVSIGNRCANALGEPSMGVQLSRHSDILEPTAFSHGQQGNLIVFKMIKGRVKLLLKKCGAQKLEPTPNCDSHMLKLSKTVTSQCSLKEMFELMQVYAYEYGELELESRPRQILPFAVIKFTYVGSKIPVPLVRPDALTASLGSNEGVVLPKQATKQPAFVVWKGHIIRKSSVCSVELVSAYNLRLPVNMKQSLEAIAVLPCQQVKDMFLSAVNKIPVDKETSCGVFYNACQVRSTVGRERMLQEFADDHRLSNAGSIIELSDGCILIILSDVNVATDLGMTLTDDTVYKMHAIILSKVSCFIDETKAERVPSPESTVTCPVELETCDPPIPPTTLAQPLLSAVSPSQDTMLTTSQDTMMTSQDTVLTTSHDTVLTTSQDTVLTTSQDTMLTTSLPGIGTKTQSRSNSCGPLDTGASSWDSVSMMKCRRTDTRTHSLPTNSVPSKSASVSIDVTLSPEQKTIQVSPSLPASSYSSSKVSQSMSGSSSPSCQRQGSLLSHTSRIYSSASLFPSARSPSSLALPLFTADFQTTLAKSVSGLSLSKSHSTSADHTSPHAENVRPIMMAQDEDEIMSIIKLVPRSGIGAIIPVQVCPQTQPGSGRPSNRESCGNITVIPTDMQRDKRHTLSDPRLRRQKKADIADGNFFEQKTDPRLRIQKTDDIADGNFLEQKIVSAKNDLTFTKLITKHQLNNSENDGKSRSGINRQSSSEQSLPKQCCMEKKSKDLNDVSDTCKDLLHAGISKEVSDIMDFKESSSAIIPNISAPRKSPQYDNVQPNIDVVANLKTDNNTSSSFNKLPGAGVLSTDYASATALAEGISSANEMKDFLNQHLDTKCRKFLSPKVHPLGANYLQKEIRSKIVSAKRRFEKRNVNTCKGMTFPGHGGSYRANTRSVLGRPLDGQGQGIRRTWLSGDDQGPEVSIAFAEGSRTANHISTMQSTDACQMPSTSIPGGCHVGNMAPVAMAVDVHLEPVSAIAEGHERNTALIDMSGADKSGVLSGSCRNFSEDASSIAVTESSRNEIQRNNETTMNENQVPFTIMNSGSELKHIDQKSLSSDGNCISSEDERRCYVPVRSSPEMDCPFPPKSDNFIPSQQEECVRDDCTTADTSASSVQKLKTNFQHKQKILKFLIKCAVQNDFFRKDNDCQTTVPVLRDYIIQRGSSLDRMTVTFPNEMAHKHKDGDERTSTTSKHQNILRSNSSDEKPCDGANQSVFLPYCMKCRDRASFIDQNGADNMINGKGLMAVVPLNAAEENLLHAVGSALHRSSETISGSHDEICNVFLREEKRHNERSTDSVVPFPCNKLSDMFEKFSSSSTTDSKFVQTEISNMAENLSSSSTTDSKFVQTEISNNADYELQDIVQRTTGAVERINDASDSKFVQTDISNITDYELKDTAQRKTETLDRINDEIDSDNNREEVSLPDTEQPCSEKSWLNACKDVDEMLKVYDIDSAMDNFSLETDINNCKKRESLQEKNSPQTENIGTTDCIMDNSPSLIENQVPNANNLGPKLSFKDISETNEETSGSPFVRKEMCDGDLQNVLPEDNNASLTDVVKCVASLVMNVIQSENDMINVSPQDDKIESKSESHVAHSQMEGSLETHNDPAHVVPEANILTTVEPKVLHKSHESDLGTKHQSDQSDVQHTAPEKAIQHDSETVIASSNVNEPSIDTNIPEDHHDLAAPSCMELRGNEIEEDTTHDKFPCKNEDKKKDNLLPTANDLLSDKLLSTEHASYGDAITPAAVNDQLPSFMAGEQTFTGDFTQRSLPYWDMLPIDLHTKETTNGKNDMIKEIVPGKNGSNFTQSECENVLAHCEKTRPKRIHAFSGRMHPYQRPNISTAKGVTMTPYSSLQELLQNHTKKLFKSTVARSTHADAAHEDRGRFHDWKRNKAKKTILLRDGMPVQRNCPKKVAPVETLGFRHQRRSVKRKATSPSPGYPKAMKIKHGLTDQDRDVDVIRNLDPQRSEAVHNRSENCSESRSATSDTSPRCTGGVEQVIPVMIGIKNSPSKEQDQINSIVLVVQNETEASTDMTERKIEATVEEKKLGHISVDDVSCVRTQEPSKETIASRVGQEKERMYNRLDELTGYCSNVTVNSLEKSIMTRRKCSPRDVSESKDRNESVEKRFSTSGEYQNELGSYMREDSFSNLMQVEERGIRISADNDVMIHSAETSPNACAHNFQKLDTDLVNKARKLDSKCDSNLHDHIPKSPSVKSLPRDHSFNVSSDDGDIAVERFFEAITPVLELLDDPERNKNNTADVSKITDLEVSGFIERKKQELLEKLDNLTKPKLIANKLKYPKALTDGHLEYRIATMLESISDGEGKGSNFGDGTAPITAGEMTPVVTLPVVSNSPNAGSSHLFGQDESVQGKVSRQVDVILDNFYEEITPLLDRTDNMDNGGQTVFNIEEERLILDLIERKKKELQCNAKRSTETGVKELETHANNLVANIDRSPLHIGTNLPKVDQGKVSSEVDNFYEEINPLLDMNDNIDNDGHLHPVNNNESDNVYLQKDRKSGFNFKEEMQLLDLIEMKKRELQCNTKRPPSETGGKELEPDSDELVENSDKSDKASAGTDVISVVDNSFHVPFLINLANSQEHVVYGKRSASTISPAHEDLKQAGNKAQLDKENSPQHHSEANLFPWNITHLPVRETADNRNNTTMPEWNGAAPGIARNGKTMPSENDDSSHVKKLIASSNSLNPMSKIMPYDQTNEVKTDCCGEAIAELKMKYINALKFGMNELMENCGQGGQTLEESGRREIVECNVAEYDTKTMCSKMPTDERKVRDYEHGTMENGCDRLHPVQCLLIDSDSLLNGNSDDLGQILRYLQLQNKYSEGIQWKVWVHTSDIKKLSDCSIRLPGLDLHWQPQHTMRVLCEFMESGLVSSMQPHHCDENPLGVTDYLQCRQALKPSSRRNTRALRVLVDVLPSKLDKRIYGQVEFIRMKTFVSLMNRYQHGRQ